MTWLSNYWLVFGKAGDRSIKDGNVDGAMEIIDGLLQPTTKSKCADTNQLEISWSTRLWPSNNGMLTIAHGNPVASRSNICQLCFETARPIGMSWSVAIRIKIGVLVPKILDIPRKGTGLERPSGSKVKQYRNKQRVVHIHCFFLKGTTIFLDISQGWASCFLFPCFFGTIKYGSNVLFTLLPVAVATLGHWLLDTQFSPNSVATLRGSYGKC